jgi:hypothetical protein
MTNRQLCLVAFKTITGDFPDRCRRIIDTLLQSLTGRIIVYQREKMAGVGAQGFIL